MAEKHEMPCGHMKAMIWAFGVLLALAAFVSSLIMNRVADIESRTTRADLKIEKLNDASIRTQADLEFIKATVIEIKQEVKRNGQP